MIASNATTKSSTSIKSSQIEESQTSEVIEKDLTLSAIDIEAQALEQQNVSSSFERSHARQTLHAESTLPQSSGKRALGIANRMASAKTLDSLYQTTVTELRKKFQCDRAIIYRFDSQSEGTVIAESLSTGYTPALRQSLSAIAFGANSLQDYQDKPAILIANAREEATSPHQIQILRQFQIMASLSLPIFLEDKTWGLLVVQHCNSPHDWKEREMGFLYQVSTELALRVQSHKLHQQAQREVARGDALSNIVQNVQTSSSLQQVFESTARSLRSFLQADRIAIFQFSTTPDSSENFTKESIEGRVVSESVNPSFVATKEIVTEKQFLSGGTFSDRSKENVWIADSIYETELSKLHIENLEQFQIKACLVVPLIKDHRPWGLVCIHQCSRSRHWQTVEVAFVQRVVAQLNLALQQADYRKQVQEKAQQLEASVEREQLIAKIAERLRTTQNLSRTLKSTVRDIRQLLQADRIGLFQFDSEKNYSVGEFVVEDVAAGVVSAMATQVQDHCFAEGQAEKYRKGRYWVVNDINTLDLPECLVELLSELQVKASVVVPLLKGDVLWGLFCIHQCRAPRDWQEADVQFAHRIGAQLNLALQQADYLNQVQEKTRQLEASVEKEQLITKITERLRTTQDLSRTLKSTVQDIRQLLKADRVGLFQFDLEKNYSVGEFVVEDVAAGVVSAMATQVQDHCFAEGQAEKYRKGRYWVVNDINTLDLPECLVELLSELQVKASVVVPLLKGDVLWGLFCIHQCRAPRDWQEADVQFAHRIGAQLNLALQQADYLHQVEQQTAKLTETADREKASKEQLQRQVIQLLTAVGPALEGDLTVRAPVNETEVGTVASAYNNTLQSLQKIVLQVQAAANQVSKTSQLSGSSAGKVTQQAQQQAQALEHALARVQKMVASTEAVAIDAQQVEAATQQTNQIVQRGDTAMNRTVDGILAIRSTVAETNQRIKRLSESSQKVSKIVSLIGHFTTQTQLLALNASIEATRAGEYGKGFAVVADEVRSLAKQSAAAATEIEQFVQEIQAGTAEVSTAMETGIQQVAAGTEMVTDARQNLTAIVEATSQISQLIADITQTTHKQADEFKVVTSTMTEATEIATQTAENSKELAHSIQQVLDTAETLQANTGRFKVQ